jgi:hypothetical protein
MKPVKICYTALAGMLGITLSGTLMAGEPDPYQQADDTWISISGTVKAVSPDAFSLNYGDGAVLVEMDDGDRDADAYKLMEGDKVTVNGMIDDDFYEATTIEAASVYVEKLDTYFYASPADEEDADLTIWYTVPVVPGETVVQGTVTQVNDEDFVVNTGLRSVTVDTGELGYDPLDDEGYQKIEPGDLVRVTGEMEDNFFERKKLEADSIVTLAD